MFIRGLSFLICLALLQFIIFDFAYTYNWLGVNDISYFRYSKLAGAKEAYTLGEFLSCSDNYFLLMVLLIPAWVVVREVKFMPYLIALIFDFQFTGLFFCFISNPFEENWNKTLWVIFSVVLFAGKVALQIFSPYFRKLNIFEIQKEKEHRIIRFKGNRKYK